MTVVEKQTLDEERALYGSKGIIINDCTFDGPADGESAVKEASDVQVNRCFLTCAIRSGMCMNWRYTTQR